MWEYQWSVGRLWPGRGSIHMLPTQQHCQQREREKQKQRQRTEEEGSKSNEACYWISCYCYLWSIIWQAASYTHFTSASLSPLCCFTGLPTVVLGCYSHSTSPFTYSVCISPPLHAQLWASMHSHTSIHAVLTHTHTSKNTLEHLFLMSHWTCSWMRFCSNKSASWISLIAVVPCYVCGS